MADSLRYSDSVAFGNIVLYKPIATRLEAGKLKVHSDEMLPIIRIMIIEGSLDRLIKDAINNFEIDNVYDTGRKIAANVLKTIFEVGVSVSDIRNSSIYMPDCLSGKTILYTGNYRPTSEDAYYISNRIMTADNLKSLFAKKTKEWEMAMSIRKVHR